MATRQASVEKAGQLFCFGFGYTCLALATALLPRGWQIAGTRRGDSGAGEPLPEGVAIRRFDRDHALGDPHAALASVTHLLSAVPPDEAGDPVLDRHFDDIARAQGLVWVGYLSTTGVYGDRAGAWVDETAEPAPTSARSRRRVAAEARWLDLWRSAGVPVHIFRLAGIYGPGRNALETVRAGRARRIDKPGHVLSRIHVEDIVAALRASMAAPSPGAVYNLCDDEPAAQAEVISFACELLDVEPPPPVPLERAQLSPMGRSFYADSRRVCNARIKRELGVSLKYPDYRAGLKALLESLTPRRSADGRQGGKGLE